MGRQFYGLSWAGRPRAPVSLPVYESPDQYPGWRILYHDDFYSCIYPAEYAPDPAALAYLRAFHPDVIPIVRRQLWMPPNSREVVTVVHWAFGRYVWHPSYALIPFHVEMPTDANFMTPNFIDFVWEDKDPREDGPGGYLPFDMRLARCCREAYDDGFDKFKIDEVLRRHKERKAAHNARLLAEHQYKQERLDRYVDLKMANFTKADYGDHVARRLRWAAAAQARGASRPFVSTGGRTQ